jgi:ribonucleoside-diphosphate reductase alpha chain
MIHNGFRTELGWEIFKARYRAFHDETWKHRAQTIVKDVCGQRPGKASIVSHPLMSSEELRDLEHFIENFMFIPGGRYIYYSGRGVSFWNNCLLYKAEEDTREEWGRLLKAQSDALMSGAGVGCDYSILRERGKPLARTGGVASGPIPLMHSVNEVGRNVRQGGNRRSAIYASLNWQHGDADEFLSVKDWRNMPIPGVPGMTYYDAKMNFFDYPAPLDGMNISLNYDNAWLESVHPGASKKRFTQEEWDSIIATATLPKRFVRNTEMAMRNGEPGFSFNFYDKENETLRNACTEVTSADDSDICNLGTVNLANINNLETLKRVVELGTKFLICGSIRADLPDEKVLAVREKNRRLGLGLMGMHEWLLKRGYRYEMNDELRSWLAVYRDESTRAAYEHADRFYISRPVGVRAIAPTGTIGLLAGTTTGIEPIYAVAYKRRWIDGDTRRYKLVIDQSAEDLIKEIGIDDPDSIETAIDLARDPERRIKFQADVQDYVDHAISSTLNIPAWGSEDNNEGLVKAFATSIAKYAPRLRGLTCYPDGARGGQPLSKVPYAEAKESGGAIFEENSDKACKSGVCGI